MFTREKTSRVMVGGVPMGGGAPISVQSMTTTKTTDVAATLDEIRRLEDAGCDIVRVSVPDRPSVAALEKILAGTRVPIVADIHFDYSVAVLVADTGVAKLRINPGNIGSRDRVEKVVERAKANKLPIRIGVNAGSLERDLLETYGYPTAEAMVESAMRHVRILEELDFRDIVVSVKASSVPLTVDAYRLLARKISYPLHLGITEAGTLASGSIYSAVGIACARNHLDLYRIAEEVERRTADLRKPVKIAVMGCAVNGPGEAREADFGIMGGVGGGQIFVGGKVVKKVPEDQLVDELEKEIRKRLAD
ncbi:MAG: ispG [Candidatus Krumholzibacteriota bacterium]|nr:ispG [Candidatus Krumholzibacteriota bacterium]